MLEFMIFRQSVIFYLSEMRMGNDPKPDHFGYTLLFTFATMLYNFYLHHSILIYTTINEALSFVIRVRRLIQYLQENIIDDV